MRDGDKTDDGKTPESGVYWLPVDLLHRVAQGQLTVAQADKIRSNRIKASKEAGKTPAKTGMSARGY